MSQYTKGARKHKVASIALSVTTALWLSGAAYLAPVVAGAQSAADLQAQISALLAQIATLQANLSTLQGGTASAGACGFTRSLTVGSTGDDVKCLQKYLNGAGYQVSASGAGSPGNESMYFGSLTRAAVAKWQAANSVSPAVGYFGSLSQAKYNSIAGGTTGGTTAGGTVGGTTPPAPAGSGLTVTAGTQPAASLFPVNSTRVPFTVLRFTAPTSGAAVIDSVTVERTGLANDAALSGVLLLDEKGTQLGLVKTLNSLHQATLTEDFTVNAGQTRTMVIAGNAQTSNGGYGGQIAYLSVVAVAANTPVVSSFPITGAGHTVNETLSIGTISTVARGSLDPGSSQTKEVGTKNYTFSSLKLTVGSQEDVYIKYIRWYQSGSASKDDLENIKVHENGGVFDATISVDGKYYTTVFNDNDGKGLKVAKGFSRELSIKGDIISGSARTIDFDIQKRTDIAINGVTYGYGLVPPFDAAASAVDGADVNNVDDPYYDAAQVEVSAGTMTVSTNSLLAPSQNVAVNLAGQPIAAFTTDVRGEPITVGRIAFNITLSGDSGSNAADVTSVSMYDGNGKVVAGPVDGVTAEVNTGGATGTSDGEIIFTDTVTFPTGVNHYVLKGKFGTDFDNADQVIASTTPRNFGTVTGQITGKTISVDPNSVLTFSTMTVRTGALTLSVSGSPIAQTVISGSSQFLFANYVLDTTQSGEDIRMTSIPLENNIGNGAVATDLTNCKLHDGSTVVNAANVKNPSSSASNTSFTFDGSGLVLTKGTQKTLSLKCDVSGSAAANLLYTWGLDGGQSTAAATYTGATGLTSGQTIVETFTDSPGQTMTVATGGTLTVVLDANSPSYAIIPAGAANVALARLKFTAANEDVNVKQVALQLTGRASNTPLDLLNSKVTLWDESVEVGSTVFDETTDTATSTLTANFIVPRGGAKTLTIKGAVAGISADGPRTASGDFFRVDYDGDNERTASYTGGNYGIGVASGNNVNPSNDDTSSSGIRIYKAYPTFAKVAVPNNSLLVGNQALKTLYRFSMTAQNGDVSLYKWTFEMGSSSVQATTSTYGLYVYTDSAFSAVDSNFATDGLINYGNCASGRNNVTSTSREPNADDSPVFVEIYADRGTVACNATTTYLLPSGATRYYSLTATVANVESATGVETISATLLGDAAYPIDITGDNATANMFKSGGNTATQTGVDSTSNDDFIWSPNSTTTHGYTTTAGNFDFINGYGLPGLPGVSMTTEYFTSPN